MTTLAREILGDDKIEFDYICAATFPSMENEALMLERIAAFRLCKFATVWPVEARNKERCK